MKTKNIPYSFYKELIDEIAEGIVSVDKGGHILFVNKATSTMLGLPQSRLIGRHFSEFVHHSSLKNATEYFAQVIKGRTVIQQVVNVRTHSGKVIPIEFSASAIKEKGKIDQLHCIFRNISERREMEEFILEQEKMKAIQHFISGMAQEIRNPLRGVFERLSKLIEEYEKKDFEYIGFREFQHLFDVLKALRTRSQYCFETTERLLNITKRKIGINGKFCDANEVAKDAVEKVRHSFDVSEITMRMKLARGLPPVAVGAIELSQAVVNVLTNAIQSIPQSGQVTLKTYYAVKEKMAVIECIDNGVGIDKENLPKIFEPFYTTKHRGVQKSSGLGLSIVYAIVKSHKGDIQIKSNLREGTRVKLVLPVHKKGR
ncbi:MAG TPA: ATP-binding protein [Candidatus Omnitrophota bacterium]|nr:ATP-binding protein [Candidatus Omnitrophota bacterium]